MIFIEIECVILFWFNWLYHQKQCQRTRICHNIENFVEQMNTDEFKTDLDQIKNECFVETCVNVFMQYYNAEQIHILKVNLLLIWVNKSCKNIYLYSMVTWVFFYWNYYCKNSEYG